MIGPVTSAITGHACGGWMAYGTSCGVLNFLDMRFLTPCYRLNNGGSRIFQLKPTAVNDYIYCSSGQFDISAIDVTTGEFCERFSLESSSKNSLIWSVRLNEAHINSSDIFSNYPPKIGDMFIIKVQIIVSLCLVLTLITTVSSLAIQMGKSIFGIRIGFQHPLFSDAGLVM